eukprot:6140903-Prymnesium_polylepis.2
MKNSFVKVQFVERMDLAEKVISPRVIDFQGSIGKGNKQRYVKVQDAVVSPFAYNEVMTTYKAQARQFRYMHAHLGKLRGKDNQAITALGRAMGNPWDGSLKVSGLFNPRTNTSPGLRLKTEPHPKSLVCTAIIGGGVDGDKVNDARAAEIEVNPRWTEVETELRAAVDSARSFADANASAAQRPS